MPDATPSWYDRHLLPWLIDLACGLAPVRQRRAAIVPRARGRVLEVGMGTGLNLAHYDRSRVTALVGVDPAAQMHALARRRSARLGLPVEIVTLGAERLPFEADSFDSVVCTYTLCSIPDPAAALAEMRRVLRPEGRMFFIEHGLAPDPGVARWQRRLEPLWGRFAGGCHLSRDVPLLLRDAGLRFEMETGYIARPHTLAYNFWGEARRA